MKKNTVNTGDAEVYSNEILRLADEYIDQLEEPEQIYNTNIFNGMIKYIYINYFKNKTIDYDDIEYIDSVWDIYTLLCYKYNKGPTIIEFSMLININRDTFNTWKNGTTRQYIYYDLNGDRIKDINAYRGKYNNAEYRRELSTRHSDTVKKWLAECENWLYRGATEQNKIGCIFALKANYGYVETAPVPTVNTTQALSAAELPKLGGNGAQLIADNQNEVNLQ